MPCVLESCSPMSLNLQHIRNIAAILMDDNYSRLIFHGFGDHKWDFPGPISLDHRRITCDTGLHCRANRQAAIAVRGPSLSDLHVSATWWRHQMETISALLALWEGNPTVTGGFPSQRPVTRSFNVFFDLRLNKRLSKQSRRRWFETLWRHC